MLSSNCWKIKSFASVSGLNTVSPELLDKEKWSVFAILKSILSSVSAEIDVSASASNNNSTPFRSTAAVKSASLAEVIVASVIPVVPYIVDSAIFFSL